MITLNIKLPDHFLDEEVQDGFLVSQKRKEVWAVELDLLTEFDRVCKKYKLRYFADGGTLLGAIRHGGFIPWDDDIDLAMFRDDYDKLCSIALHEFKNPYFFQTEYTDRGSLRGHAQLRNSNTTAILRNSLNCKYKFNQGIFIDIFPMDSVTENQSKFLIQGIKVTFYKWLSRIMSRSTDTYANQSGNIKRDLIMKIFYIFLKTPLKNLFLDYDMYYKMFEDNCTKYNEENTEFISLLSFQFFNKRNFKYRVDYDECFEAKFEFITIPVMNNYERVLNINFGDWKKFIIGTSDHGTVFFDTEKSYKKYIEDSGASKNGVCK